MIRTLRLLPFSILLATPALAQEFSPGMWEVTSTLTKAEMPGMPAEMASAMTGQATTFSYCVTAEQLEAGPEALFEQEGQCTFDDFTLEGGQMEMTGVCTAPGAPGALNISSSGTYTATSYESRSVIDMDMQGAQMRMEADGVGRRTGDC